MPWSIKQAPFLISWLTLGSLVLTVPVLAFMISRASNQYSEPSPYQGYVPLNQRAKSGYSNNYGGNRQLARKMYEGAYGNYGGAAAEDQDYSTYYKRGQYDEATTYGANQYSSGNNQYSNGGNQNTGGNYWGGNGQDLYSGSGSSSQSSSNGQQQAVSNYGQQQYGYYQQGGHWNAESAATEYNNMQYQQNKALYGDTNCYDWDSCKKQQEALSNSYTVSQAHANGDTVNAPSWWLWGTEDSEEKTGLLKFIVFIYFCSLGAFGYILKWGYDKAQTGSVDKLKRLPPLLFGSAIFSFFLYLLIGGVDGLVMFDTANAYEHGFYGQSAVLAMFTFLLWSIFAVSFGCAIHFRALCFSYKETIDDYEIHSDPEKAEIVKPVQLGRTMTTPASMFSKAKVFFKASPKESGTASVIEE